MARKGQAAGRKRKEVAAEDSDSDSYYMDEEDGTQQRGKRTLRVLPVADIDDDWEGEPEDGATYLALVNRANAKLPAVTRVANPYRAPSPPPIAIAVPNQEDEPIAGPSRHPALPSEAWAVSFEEHFRNYRKHVSETWSSIDTPAYPEDYPTLPDFDHRHEWVPFIKGYTRKKVKRRIQREGEQGQDEGMVDEGGEEDATMDQAEEDDEEAWMNAGMEPEPIFEDVLEEETARHRPKEPTLSVLKRLDTTRIISILLQISYDLSNKIDALSTSLPTQPQGQEDTASPSPTSQDTPDPYSPLLCKWVLSVLSILDTHLLATDISHLRDFARVIMRVGGWRWIKGVSDGEVDSKWSLGAKGWKPVENGQGGGAVDSASVDETLARCWMTVHAIAVGWGQRDLLQDLEDLFK